MKYGEGDTFYAECQEGHKSKCTYSTTTRITAKILEEQRDYDLIKFLKDIVNDKKPE